MSLLGENFGKESRASHRSNAVPAWNNGLSTILREWFQSRLLPVTKTIADRWGVLAGQFKLKGRILTLADGLIAATALGLDLTLDSKRARFHRPWCDHSQSVDSLNLAAVPKTGN